MAEAIFTSKKIKSFSYEQTTGSGRTFDTPFSRFPKNFFMSYRPADTGNWNCQNKKPYNLYCNTHNLDLVLIPSTQLYA